MSKSFVTRLAEHPRAKAVAIGLLAVVAVGGIIGREGFSYLRAFKEVAKDGLSEKMTVQFELERARAMVLDLLPEIRETMVAVAEDEVAVKQSNSELTATQRDLEDQKQELLHLRADLENSSGAFKVGSRPATPEEVKQELKRRFGRYQTSEATLSVKQDIAETRNQALRKSRERLQNLVNAARDLDAQIEQMEARIRHQELVKQSSQLDSGQLARCEELIDDIRRRLDVADQLVATEIPLEEFLFATYVETGTDIGQEIDQYFATVASTDAAPNRKD